jgi:hypothetical protein
MKKSRLIGALSATVLSLITLPTHAALTSVLGGQAYYDDQLDITWTANADINSGATWDNQVAWAAGLNIDGVTGWRLASIDVNGDNVIVPCTTDQAACKDNEYGHLFNYGAGTVFGNGITPSTPNPFSNVQSGLYWSSTESTLPDTAWGFFFNSSLQFQGDKDIDVFAWAVHPGNVSEVPIPAAVWLFGSGLLGLIGVARRKVRV